jgi:hypothetical protein
LGAEKEYTAAGATKHGTDFVLTRHGDHFSLSAQQASLRDIVDTLGRLLDIDVVARIPWDMKISLDFADLTLDDALRQFSTFANVVYITNTRLPAGKITRVIVLPVQGGDSVPQPPVRSGVEHPAPTSARPEPFKFEFDPSKLMEGKR